MSDDKNKSPEPGNSEKPDIRYVPVEYKPYMQDEKYEMDLVELAKSIWEGRWTIIKITAVFVTIGLFIALFSPVEYESEAILMPEVQQQQEGRAGQLLQQFGGAFGLGGGGIQMSPGTIPPMIYPRIVNSLSFQVELLEQEIRFADYEVTTTIPDFYDNHYSYSLTQWVQRLTFGLPFTILEWMSGEEEAETVLEEDPFADEFIQISKKELELIKTMRDRISVNLDEETGLLTSRVTLHDARASAELNRHVIELLKQYVTDYRLEKARKDLEFVEQQHESSRVRFEREQIRLAEFRDQNVTLTTARAQTELERLQDQKDVAFNVFNTLSQQLEQARLQVQEQTPVFSMVQAVNVPSDKSSPRRGYILTLLTALGIFISIAIVTIKYLLNK
ncbi:MAG: hypothetical protein EA412_10945 [Chitinophagaceae bacterium]|nr:MAG: hypothetical protein EA412_10945 [Chitinophagaceae bacterium]